MPIKLICRCGRNLIVPEERAGRLIACPKCQHKMLVPGERKPVAEPIVESVAAATSVAAIGELEPAAASTAAKVVPPVSKPAEVKSAPPAPSPPKSLPKPPPLKPTEPAPVATAAATSVTNNEPAAPAPPALVAKSLAPPPLVSAARTAVEKVSLASTGPSPPKLASSKATQVATAPAPSPVPDEKRVFGYQHDADKLAAAYVLATLVILLAAFSIVPAAFDIVRFLRQPDGDPVGRFAYALLFLGLLQFAYAIYLAQLPDWGSSWVLTGVVLLQAAMYMAILTTIQLAQGQSPLVQWLDLHSHIDNGRVRAWCFMMLLLSGVVAYFCGSVSMRWRRAFQSVRTAYGR